MDETNDPRFWTAKEVGRLIKLSPKSVYRLAATDPTFPVAKIGGARRFPSKKVLSWINQRPQGAKA
jgi:predicted DNA-binding transcriptional regulator AlpA